MNVPIPRYTIYDIPKPYFFERYILVPRDSQFSEVERAVMSIYSRFLLSLERGYGGVTTYVSNIDKSIEVKITGNAAKFPAIAGELDFSRATYREVKLLFRAIRKYGSEIESYIAKANLNEKFFNQLAIMIDGVYLPGVIAENVPLSQETQISELSHLTKQFKREDRFVRSVAYSTPEEVRMIVEHEDYLVKLGYQVRVFSTTSACLVVKYAV